MDKNYTLTLNFAQVYAIKEGLLHLQKLLQKELRDNKMLNPFTAIDYQDCLENCGAVLGLIEELDI